MNVKYALTILFCNYMVQCKLKNKRYLSYNYVSFKVIPLNLLSSKLSVERKNCVGTVIPLKLVCENKNMITTFVPSIPKCDNLTKIEISG